MIHRVMLNAFPKVIASVSLDQYAHVPKSFLLIGCAIPRDLHMDLSITL